MITTIKQIIKTIKQDGLKTAWIQYRWKMMAVIVFYYLIRDTLIYLVLPYMVLQYQ